MVKVEFKDPVNGMTSTVCTGISIDPMDDTLFLIQFGYSGSIWQTPLNNIKHISSYERP